MLPVKETISVVLNINPSPTIFLDPPPTWLDSSVQSFQLNNHFPRLPFGYSCLRNQLLANKAYENVACGILSFLVKE